MEQDDALAPRGDDEELAPSPIKIDARKLSPQRAGIVVSKVAQYARIAQDVMKDIANAPATTEYVVQIPAAIQDKLESGEYKLMRRETGELLCAVTKKSDKSNRQVIAKRLDAVERTVPNTTPKQQADIISADLYDIAIQQQMAELSAQLEAVLDGVKRIEQGQQDDRYALIEAAESQLKIAAVVEDETHRLEAIRSAQHLLQEGTAKISRAMARRLQEVDEVPEHAPLIAWKMLTTRGNYYDEMNEWFDGIQESFEVLEKAYAMLSLCAIAMDEPKMLDVLLDEYQARLSTMDTQKLLTMGNIHPDEEFEGEWFANPARYVEARREEAKLLSDGEYIDITVTGEMLLEAMEDETGEAGERGEEDEPIRGSE